MSRQTNTVHLCGEGSAAASRQNELPAGGDVAGSSAESSKAPAQSACETNEDSSNSDSESSVAAGGGTSSTKSCPSASCEAPLLLLWEQAPTAPSLSLLPSSLFSQALCAGAFELSACPARSPRRPIRFTEGRRQNLHHIYQPCSYAGSLCGSVMKSCPLLFCNTVGCLH